MINTLPILISRSNITMNMWGNNGGQASNSVLWAAESINQGSGKVHVPANNTALYQNVTPGAWVTGNSSSAGPSPPGVVITTPIHEAIGQFAVSKQQKQGSYSNQAYLLTPTFVGNPGMGYNNTDFIIASNGSVNANLAVTTNAAGNIASLAFTSNTQGVWQAGVANNTVVLTVYAAN